MGKAKLWKRTPERLRPKGTSKEQLPVKEKGTGRKGW